MTGVDFVGAKEEMNKSRTEFELGLIDLLGENLYDVLASGEIEQEMPLGVRSKYNFRDRRVSFKKKLANEWDILFEMMKDDYKVKIKREF